MEIDVVDVFDKGQSLLLESKKEISIGSILRYKNKNFSVEKISMGKKRILISIVEEKQLN